MIESILKFFKQQDLISKLRNNIDKLEKEILVLKKIILELKADLRIHRRTERIVVKK